MAYMLHVDIAGQDVLIPADQVQAVVRADHVEPVPGVAADIAGVMTLRGQVLTVIDPAVRLCGRDARGAGEQVAVVVRSGDHGYALLCDRAEDVREVDEVDIAPPPPGFSAAWREAAVGTAPVGMRRVAILSPGRFLASFQAGQPGNPAPRSV